jgi:broad specificity phosphatase PhoE
VIAFVRHGQTTANRAGQLQGRVDTPLTDAGAEQAARLGDVFAAAAVSRVVSSPLGRALETANAIAIRHGLHVEVDDRLAELDYGEWDQRPMQEIAAEEWARWRDDPAFTPPGGEPLVDVTARIAAFCLGSLGEELVVAVSHVSPIKAAVCWALGVDERVTWRMYLDLASVTRLGSRPDGTVYLASYNETAHLKS